MLLIWSMRSNGRTPARAAGPSGLIEFTKTPCSSTPSETEKPKVPSSRSLNTIARRFSLYPAVATERKSLMTSSNKDLYKTDYWWSRYQEIHWFHWEPAQGIASGSCCLPNCSRRCYGLLLDKGAADDVWHLWLDGRIALGSFYSSSLSLPSQYFEFHYGARDLMLDRGCHLYFQI